MSNSSNNWFNTYGRMTNQGSLSLLAAAWVARNNYRRTNYRNGKSSIARVVIENLRRPITKEVNLHLK